MKYLVFSVFCIFLISTCLCDLFANKKTTFNFAGTSSSQTSASAAGTAASASTHSSVAGSLMIPVHGIVGMPANFVGVLFQKVDGLLGTLLPGLSIVANISANVVNIASANVAASALSADGTTLNITITLPSAGILRVVGLNSALQPVLSLVGDLLQDVSSLLGSVTGAVNGHVNLQLGNTLGIFCTAAPGCSVSLKAILLNGVQVSNDLVLSGSSSSTSLSDALSVLITSDALLSGDLVINAQLSISCNSGLGSTLGSTVSAITGCNFLFSLLNGVAGGVLGGLL